MSIIIVGSLNMDLIARTPRIPVPGETLSGYAFATTPGGKGANQAVAAVKLGAAVNIVGRVGSDEFGKALRSQLGAAGVDTQFVVDDPETATGIALICVDDNGQNTIIGIPGANTKVSRRDVNAARGELSIARVVLAQLDIPLDTAAYVLRVGRAAGALTILIPSPAQPLTRAILQDADLIIPNETEAAQLTNIPVGDFATAADAANALRDMGARRVLITLGGKGALWLDKDLAPRHIPAFPVQTVDTTGAGDAFVGALAAALADGRDWETSLRMASAAGAFSATKPGTQSSLPTRAELEAFMTRV